MRFRDFVREHPFGAAFNTIGSVMLIFLGLSTTGEDVLALGEKITWLLTSQWGKGILVGTGVLWLLLFWFAYPFFIERSGYLRRHNFAGILGSRMNDIEGHPAIGLGGQSTEARPKGVGDTALALTLPVRGTPSSEPPPAPSAHP